MIIHSERVKNIICFRNDRFGEFLLNIPALRALKKTYAQARLVLITQPYVKELAGCIDGVDRVITWENSRHKFSEIIKFSKRLKDDKYDLCVIFNPSREFNIISFLAQIPVRIGYNRKLGFLLTHKIKDEKYLGARHEIEYNLELAQVAKAEIEDNSLSISIDEHIAGGLLSDFNIRDSDKFVALHPWTSDPIKQWPVNNFYELAKRLAAGRELKVVIIGGKEEAVKSGEFLKQDNIANMAGRTTLVQLAALLKKSKLLISGDSGPVHLACAVNTPVIAIFRNDIPAKSARRWGPWGYGHVVIEKNNLNEISVDEVFNRARQILEGCLEKYLS